MTSERHSATELYVRLVSPVCGILTEVRQQRHQKLFPNIHIYRGTLTSGLDTSNLIDIIADKAYDCSAVRNQIIAAGKIPIIPRRKGFTQVFVIRSAIKRAPLSSGSFAKSKKINGALYVLISSMLPSFLSLPWDALKF